MHLWYPYVTVHHAEAKVRPKQSCCRCRTCVLELWVAMCVHGPKYTACSLCVCPGLGHGDRFLPLLSAVSCGAPENLASGLQAPCISCLSAYTLPQCRQPVQSEKEEGLDPSTERSCRTGVIKALPCPKRTRGWQLTRLSPHHPLPAFPVPCSQLS